jgi:diadenosine tetraphosphate (Ap4A) HIT family hydrolase
MNPEQSSDSGTCPLCRVVVDSTEYPEPFMYNTRLLETLHFVVTPCIGPLVRGHVIVVSRTHCESLASMGEAAVREYDALAIRLRSAPLLLGDDALEAEHGSTPDDKAGACVVHTHVHWLPGMGRFIGEFRRRLPVIDKANLFDLSSEPYIFVRNGDERSILGARGLPSQMIRRILCDALGRHDADWTKAPRLDWIEETVEAWRAYEESL